MARVVTAAVSSRCAVAGLCVRPGGGGSAPASPLCGAARPAPRSAPWLPQVRDGTAGDVTRRVPAVCPYLRLFTGGTGHPGFHASTGASPSAPELPVPGNLREQKVLGSSSVGPNLLFPGAVGAIARRGWTGFQERLDWFPGEAGRVSRSSWPMAPPARLCGGAGAEASAGLCRGSGGASGAVVRGAWGRWDCGCLGSSVLLNTRGGEKGGGVCFGVRYG